jgi:hypothetical protein
MRCLQREQLSRAVNVTDSWQQLAKNIIPPRRETENLAQETSRRWEYARYGKPRFSFIPTFLSS